MERLGKPRHGREGRRLSEREVSESNPVALPLILQRAVSTSLDMTQTCHFRSATIKFASL